MKSSNIIGKKAPHVAIIVLNWNGWKDTIECLESLRRIDYPNHDIIVVDNGSKDESVVKIREYVVGKVAGSRYFEDGPRKRPTSVIEYARKRIAGRNSIEGDPLSSPSEKRIILIKNERDYGFAEGNNIGIRFALRFLNPAHILLLSNDTVVDRSFLTNLVKVAEEYGRIGIVGPKIYYYDFFGRSDIINFAGEDMVIWKAKGIRYGFNELDNGQNERMREVDKVDGACMLIKKAVLEDVGLLDPIFFLYWEETDFCLRAKKRGFKLLYIPKSKIWHKVSASYGGSSNPVKEYFMTRNRFIFVRKHASAKEKLGFLLTFFLFDFWIEGISLVKRKNARLLISFAGGVKNGIKELGRGEIRKGAARIP